MKGPRVIVLCWLAAVAMISFVSVRAGNRPPASAFAGSATVYSLLAVLGAWPPASSFAGVLAVGWTISLASRIIGSKPSEGGPPGKRAPGPSPHPQPGPLLRPQPRAEAA